MLITAPKTKVVELNQRDITRLIKQELKALYPATTFSVRSDNGSIRVYWENGPTSRQVKENVTDKYEGVSFDGMQDLESYKDALVKDGVTYIIHNKYVLEQRTVTDNHFSDIAHEFLNTFGGFEFPEGVTLESLQAIENITYADIKQVILGKELFTRRIERKIMETDFSPAPAAPYVDLKAEQKPTDLIITNNIITVNHNKELNGVEISFKTKPDSSTINTLKSNGFRWSGYNKVWYTKYTEAKYNFAVSLID